MRRLLSILGVCAALVMLGVSGAMNYLFLSSLGKTALEGQVLGGASAAADLLKALLPFFIAWAWRARRIVASTAGVLLFTFFSGFSLLSAIGFAAGNREVVADRREGITARFESVQRELRDAEGKYAALPAHRPASVVAEELERERQNRRWTATRECADATEVQSRTFCEQYFALRAELAAGREGERLAGTIAGFTNELSRLRADGAGQDRDPQVSLVSRIFGIAEERVRLALIILVALLVEAGSSLGLFLASGHGEGLRPVSAKARDETASALTLTGSIEKFCLERLVAAESGRLSTKQLLDAYVNWSKEKGALPLHRKAFAAHFDRLAQSIGLSKHGSHYGRIALRRNSST